MHQRLKGASVASYYPPRIGTIAQLRSLYPENELLDDAEEDWLEHLNVARSRGKAVPKKKRTAAGTFAGCRGLVRSLTRCRIEKVQQEEVSGESCIYTVQEQSSISSKRATVHHVDYILNLDILNVDILITPTTSCSSPSPSSHSRHAPSQTHRPTVSSRPDDPAAQEG